MTCHPNSERVVRCAGLMKTAGLDVLLLAKPANMAYLTGDGRLCAYAMITKEGGSKMERINLKEEEVST